MKLKHCKWCDTSFQTAISYQIYCSSSCRDLATKEKITARYEVIRRNRRLGKTRLCKSCNGKLSIYNDDLICQFCEPESKDISKTLKEIKGLMNGKTWES